MAFDPVWSRYNYLKRDDSCYYNLLDSFVRKQYEPQDPMGNIATHDVDSTIKCWLYGLFQQTVSVLPRSVEWLTIAIEQDEDFDTHRDYHRQKLRSALALAKWLHTGDAAVGDWKLARELELSNLTDDGIYPKNKIKTDGVDDYLSTCIQAECFEEGIVEFEKYHGAQSISLKKTLKPREFGYAVCLNKVKPQFDGQALLQAGRKMLQANLENNWLGSGQFARGAVWLKNVYWEADRTLTPLETILKAYDDMPNVARPSFIE